ncbi:MAG TPA: energy transducer TonB [Acidobacteriaceae bacterium]|jgi:hypothetical protein|nr:energy transducer TonB [Acidobacteriaceae bacterium]
MRRILVASLLSAVTLAASAATPKPNDNATLSTAAVAHRVSTGISGPQIENSTTINIPGDASLSSYPNPAKVVLRLSLDETGKSSNIEVVQPLSPTMNARVIEAVREFRWRPATLDNQTIPVDVNLVVQLDH